MGGRGEGGGKRRENQQKQGSGEVEDGVKGDLSFSTVSRIQSAGPQHSLHRQQSFFLIRGSALFLLLWDVQHIPHTHTTHLLTLVLHAIDIRLKDVCILTVSGLFPPWCGARDPRIQSDSDLDLCLSKCPVVM